jgi:heat-inducible transcriptional repressor
MIAESVIAMSESAYKELNERAQHLLKVLVQRHIRDGQPVGSRALTRDSGLALSPATVRNVMSDLENLGYVQAPHTSAGRVPTDKGYRFFVDSLLTVRQLSVPEVERLRIRLDLAGGSEGLVGSASSLLSGLTRYAGLVTLPRHTYNAFRQVEFLPLSDRRVLVIVVANEHEVQNRVIRTDREFSSDELRRISNYLNHEFSGKDFRSVRKKLVQDIDETRKSVNQMMASVVEVAKKVFVDPPPENDYVLAGETNLMEHAELANVEKLRELFDAFSQKRDVLHILDQSIGAQGVQIFIGQESGYEVFDGVSMVTSTYTADGEVLGVLGVIGPTRMPYERVIPIVDLTARLLGDALNPKSFLISDSE